MTRFLIPATLAFLLLSPPAVRPAVDLGGCGLAKGASQLVANPVSGLLITAGQNGIGVHDGNISNVDYDRIKSPSWGFLFASPDGERLAIWTGKSVYLFDFSTLDPIGKGKVKGVKDPSVYAWQWVAGTDDVVMVAARVKSSTFTMKTTVDPYLVRLDVQTGAAKVVPLLLDGDFLSAAVAPTGEHVALGFRGGRVDVRSAHTGELLVSHTEHTSTPWNSMGLVFEDDGQTLVSNDGGKLVYFDLGKKEVRSMRNRIQGGRYVRLLSGGDYVLAGDTGQMTLYDEQGKGLERHEASMQPEIGLEGLFMKISVAEGVKRVYALGGNTLCWYSFKAWLEAGD